MPVFRKISRADVFDNRIALAQRVFNRLRVHLAPAPLDAVLVQQQPQRVSPQSVAAIQPELPRQRHDIVRFGRVIRLKIPDDHRHTGRAAARFLNRNIPLVPRKDRLRIVMLIVERHGEQQRLDLALFRRRGRAEEQRRRQHQRENTFHYSTMSPGR